MAKVLPTTNKAVASRRVLNIAFIRERRTSLGLSQEAAARAAKIGTTRQAWNKIETNAKRNITLDTLKSMARVLKCKAGDLIDE